MSNINFWSEKCWVWKKNLSEKNFGSKSKIFLRLIKILCQKKFGSEKMLVGTKCWVRKKCLVRKFFWDQKFFLDWKTILGLKNVGSEKILGTKNFVVVLVVLVTWTKTPLNSAKSPWVVYVSNFSLLVHSPLIDFGEGSSSCF